jgi:ABC-2 type transport system ATP-binding protein
VLDEPTDGLDPNQKHEVRDLIKEMAYDKAIIISTHILEEVEAVCARAMIIADGKLLFSGSPKQLAAKSKMHNAVTISIRTDTAIVAKADLLGLPEVAGLEELDTVDDCTRLLVLPARNRSILKQVSAAIHSAGWEIQELKVAEGRLDEVFRMITTGSEERTRS